jgi:hypothetical protein
VIIGVLVVRQKMVRHRRQHGQGPGLKRAFEIPEGCGHLAWPGLAQSTVPTPGREPAQRVPLPEMKKARHDRAFI